MDKVLVSYPIHLDGVWEAGFTADQQTETTVGELEWPLKAGGVEARGNNTTVTQFFGNPT